jgi:hypothetical protein
LSVMATTISDAVTPDPLTTAQTPSAPAATVARHTPDLGAGAGS